MRGLSTERPLLGSEDDVEMSSKRPMAPRKSKQSTKEARLLRELQAHMQEKMTTDVFGVFAAVLRKRIGAIDERHGEQALWDTLMLKKDIQIFAFSFFGILMSVVTTTMFWYFGKKKETSLSGIQLETQMAGLYFTQLCLTVSTFVTMALIGQKYQLLLFNKRMEWANMSMRRMIKTAEDEAKSRELMSAFESSYSFLKSSLRYKLGGELFVHLLHPLIWMKVSSDGNAYVAFQILIFLRLYLVLNLIFKFSSPFRRRMEIVANNAELQRTGFQPTVGGTLTIVFYRYPYLLTLTILFIALVLFGFLEFITERINGEPFASLENSVWFTFVTFSTVGYGDMVPTSLLGRLTSVATGALGITTTTVFGGVVTNLMQQSREQRSVSQYLQEIEADAALEDSAARVVQLAYRHTKMVAKDIVNPWVVGGHKSNVVYGAIKNFKSHRWQKSQTQNAANDPVTDSKINHITSTLLTTQRRMMDSSNTLKTTMANINTFASEMRSILDPNYSEVKDSSMGGRSK